MKRIDLFHLKSINKYGLNIDNLFYSIYSNNPGD